jgi:hypothetical protein
MLPVSVGLHAFGHDSSGGPAHSSESLGNDGIEPRPGHVRGGSRTSTDVARSNRKGDDDDRAAAREPEA